MSRPSFEQSFKKHIANEQRREVMSTLRATLRRQTTLGEIVDAAGKVGWSEAMGELTLADLARALVEDSNETADAKPSVASRSRVVASPRETASFTGVASVQSVPEKAAPASDSDVEPTIPRGRKPPRTQQPLLFSETDAPPAAGDTQARSARGQKTANKTAKKTVKKTAKPADSGEVKRAGLKGAAATKETSKGGIGRGGPAAKTSAKGAPSKATKKTSRR